MKRLVLAAALLAGGTLGLENVTWAHGGTYRGPGDTVPPGGAGSGGGGGPASGPRAPGTPPGNGPGSPRSGGPGGPGGPGGGPLTGGGGDIGPDLTVWSFWWEFNKEPYLNLKAAIHSEGTQTGSEGFYLGHGQKEESKDTHRPTEAQIRQQVVPALEAALEKETNNDIVTGCLVALAKIGDEKSENGESAFQKIIAKFLADSNQEISETAAVALGILANEDSIGLLNELLQDDPDGRKAVGGKAEVPFRTRAFAAYGLGLIGHVATEGNRQIIVRDLVQAIASDNTKSRDLKVAAIISLGLVPLETIEPETPPAEGQTLDPSTSRAGQIAYLRAFLDDKTNNFLIRAHVPTALGRLVEAKGLSDEQRQTYKDAIVKDLLALFARSSKEPVEVVESAVLAMGIFGDADSDATDAAIRKALASVPKEQSDQQAKNFAMIAMAKVGSAKGGGEGADDGAKDAAKFLLEQLSRGKSGVRPWAGLAIGVMGRRLADNQIGVEQTADLSAALRNALSDEKNPQDVGAYAIGAGISHDLDSQTILFDKLENLRDDEARGYVAVALGLLGALEAKDPIRAIVKESEYRPELLRQAAIALGLLGDKDLVPYLTKTLGEATNLATQAAISSALGFIGDERSITPLVDMLQNTQLTETARGFAAVALGIVADKEDLPWNSKIGVDLNYRAATNTLTDSSTGILDIL